MKVRKFKEYKLECDKCCELTFTDDELCIYDFKKTIKPLSTLYDMTLEEAIPFSDRLGSENWVINDRYFKLEDYKEKHMQIGAWVSYGVRCPVCKKWHTLGAVPLKNNMRDFKDEKHSTKTLIESGKTIKELYEEKSLTDPYFRNEHFRNYNVDRLDYVYED